MLPQYRPVPANIVAARKAQLRDAAGAGMSVEEQTQRINESVYKAFLDALAQLRGNPQYQLFFTAMAPVAALDSNYTVGAISQQVSPQRAGRQYLLIVNIGANDLRVSLGRDASATTGLILPANGFYEPARPISSSINLFSTAGTTATIVEG